MPKDQVMSDEDVPEHDRVTGGTSSDNDGLSTDSPTVAEQKPMSPTEWAMLYAGCPAGAQNARHG